MSYVLGSDPRDLWFVLGGTGVMVISLQVLTSRANGNPGRVVARCADGTRIGEWGSGVRHRPDRARGLRSWLAGWRGLLRPRLREDLEPGDLTDLRVREGREGEAAWVVEGIDRGEDPFHLHWEFATAEEAIVAFRLLDQRIVQPVLDAEGRPVRLTDREFEEQWVTGESAGPPRTTLANASS